MIRFQYVTSGGEQLATSVDLPGGEDGPQRRRPVVIAVHGLTGHRIGRSYLFVELGRMLNEHGIACVRFDQAGCGESTGDFRRVTIPSMTADVRAIRQWAAHQPWCDPQRIGYVGMSLGALPAVAADAEHTARGVALWAPVYDMPRVFAVTARTGLRGILEGQGWVPYRGLTVGKGFVDEIDAIDTSSLLTESAAPLLLFHSKADDVVRFEESESYEQRCRDIGRLCELIRFNGADHDFSEYGDRRRLLERTVGFFEQSMPATP